MREDISFIHPKITNGVNLDDQQKSAIIAMLGGFNVFLTGRAGTGKSTVLREYKRFRQREIAFLAPTGIAALNINGQTLHSYFHLPIGIQDATHIPKEDPEMEAALRATRAVVLDEISMVRADVFRAMDSILRSYSPKHWQNTPFGGRQIIVIGDFAQLSPVVKDGPENSLLKEFHGGTFAFETDSWRDAKFVNIELENVYRQNEAEFLDILGAIRNGGDSPSGMTLEDSIKKFNERVRLSVPLDGDDVSLCTTKRAAAEINRRQINKVEASDCFFEGKVSGHFEMDELPVDMSLMLREGARVMIVANSTNNCGGYSYVNGDTGVVIELRPDDPGARVLLDNGREVWVTPATWTQFAYSVQLSATTHMRELDRRVVGTYTQIPIRLGYAATIHKAQGLTLPKIHVQLGSRGPFAHGQLYVALSRCKTLAGISLDRPLLLSDVIVDRRVREFMAENTDADCQPSPALDTGMPAA